VQSKQGKRRSNVTLQAKLATSAAGNPSKVNYQAVANPDALGKAMPESEDRSQREGRTKQSERPGTTNDRGDIIV
jgi:hypothetical protein